MAGDGDIYAANSSGQVLKIDTTINNFSWIGDPLYSGILQGWGDPIVGADKCIYWPPIYANRVLKFDPETQQLPSHLMISYNEIKLILILEKMNSQVCNFNLTNDFFFIIKYHIIHS